MGRQPIAEQDDPPQPDEPGRCSGRGGGGPDCSSPTISDKVSALPASANAAPGLAIDINDHTGRIAPSELAWLEKQARAALQQLTARGEVRIAIVDDEAMSRAHKTSHGDDSTTDVITFDLREAATAAGSTAGAAELDVDMYICADEAERQAARREWNRARELLLYLIHGCLHCLGYDDGDEQSAQAMHAREDDILVAIGIGATFAAAPQPRPSDPPGREEQDR